MLLKSFPAALGLIRCPCHAKGCRSGVWDGESGISGPKAPENLQDRQMSKLKLCPPALS